MPRREQLKPPGDPQKRMRLCRDCQHMCPHLIDWPDQVAKKTWYRCNLGRKSYCCEEAYEQQDVPRTCIRWLEYVVLCQEHG
jgi:hypothetical protein